MPSSRWTHTLAARECVPGCSRLFGSGHAAGTHNSCDSCSSAGHWDVQHQGRGKALSSRAHLQLSTGSRPLVPLHCTCPAWWAAGYTHCHTTATVTMPLLAAWPSNLYPLVGPPVRLDPASGSAGAIWKRGPRYPATGGALVAKMPRAPSCNRDVRTAWPLAGARALPTLAAGPVAGVSQPPMDAIVGGAKGPVLRRPPLQHRCRPKRTVAARPRFFFDMFSAACELGAWTSRRGLWSVRMHYHVAFSASFRGVDACEQAVWAVVAANLPLQSAEWSPAKDGDRSISTGVPVYGRCPKGASKGPRGPRPHWSRVGRLSSHGAAHAPARPG